MIKDKNQNKIFVLPNNIINQIAAGEVVERPASVLKELVENSLDAGATEVKVYAEEGGLKSLKIVDNGCGMLPEDAKTAFLPHSTSKIKDLDDLENILTLGFRGEALASISSVSKVEMVTKVADEISGFRIQLNGGEIVKEESAGASDGTSTHIREIFFNTPARRKFLKKDTTELRHIFKTFTELALANPQIAFELHHNSKQLHKLPKATTLKERIRNLIGKDLAENGFEVYYDGIIKVDGFAGLPKVATKRKSNQIIIVNDRPITNGTITAAVKEAFRTAMPANMHPQFILNIKLDPIKIDVNVHPRKLEVRFSNDSEIFRAVRSAVKAGLEKSLQQDTESKLSTFSTQPSATPPANATGARTPKTYTSGGKSSPARQTSINDALSFTKSLLETHDDNPLPWEDSPLVKRRSPNEMRTEGAKGDKMQTDHPVYQLMNAYLITSNGHAIQIIDQHAAAERVTYERLMKQHVNRNFDTQSLLIPFELELNSQELLILAENLIYFEDFGVKIEEFGANSYVVRQVPVEVKDSDLNAFVKEMLSDIMNLDTSDQNELQKRKEKLLTTMACHSSVRVGDKMSQTEIEKLLEDLQNCDVPYSCPHGRPIIYEVPVSELEKKFQRA